VIPAPPNLRLVGRFWAAYQARDWAGAQALLAPDMQCIWRATRERFVGPAATVAVNAAYPEGWSIHLLALHALDEQQVLSLVRVDQAGRQFWANSYFRLQDGLIHVIDEYWSDAAESPPWREGLAGRHLELSDTREGLPLAPKSWA
jgi:hypothetical protein